MKRAPLFGSVARMNRGVSEKRVLCFMIDCSDNRSIYSIPHNPTITIHSEEKEKEIYIERYKFRSRNATHAFCFEE